MNVYPYNRPFTLECGATLPRLDIAYTTYGEARGDNVVWVCHALTASSEVADWWPHTIEAGRFLDPASHFVVCANILSSPYGTTSPIGPGEALYGDFPAITIRDIAAAHLLLADHLGVERATLVGSSIGGFQAMEMALLRPGFAKKLALIATSARATPWMIAFNESQRMAIAADGTFGRPTPDAGREGMRAARSIGLLSYRGEAAYNATQQETDGVEKTTGFRAASYQRHQGEKLARRFNAYSYKVLLDAFDSHDVGRGRGGIAQALAALDCPTLLVGITSDLLFPIHELEILDQYISHTRLEVIDSDFGHDGFLVEHDQLNRILLPFI